MSDSKGQGMTKYFLSATDKNPSCIMPEKLTLDSPLQFECHPGVSCFTACCHNIRIILTPYDIMVLRRRLKMSAHEFLSQYTEPIYLEKTDMPGVQLKLTGEKQGCPFVTPDGCTVYSDRPTACRYYPVGMADFHEGGKEGEEDKFFFIVKEPHCKGFEEQKRWTVREWREDQGVDIRDEMNKEWLRLVMRRKSFSLQASLSEAAQRMFFMASTDLDHFRRFVFESTFLQTYQIDPETVEKIRHDDEALLHFSFKYLASALFGAEGLAMNQEKVQEKVKAMRQEQGENMRKLEEEYHALKAEREARKKAEEARRKS